MSGEQTGIQSTRWMTADADPVVRDRVAMADDAVYHLVTRERDGYVELCRDAADPETNVYDRDTADLSDRRQCHRCKFLDERGEQ